MGIVRYISYILYLLSQILYLSYYLFISDCQQYILWQLIRGVDIWPDRVCSHGCFLCVDACHPCIIIFCYFLYITFVTWYRLSVGSFCMSLWFCWVESPSGSSLRSMGKLGLDWIGLDIFYILTYQIISKYNIFHIHKQIRKR
jgi:hypothetical protein